MRKGTVRRTAHGQVVKTGFTDEGTHLPLFQCIRAFSFQLYLSGTLLVATFHFSKLAVRTNVTTKGKCVLKGSMCCRENKAVVSKAKVTLELSLKSGVQFPKVDV